MGTIGLLVISYHSSHICNKPETCFYYYLVYPSVKEEAREEKIVTSVKKGSAVMDKCLPDNIKAQYHVLQVVSHFNGVFSKQRNRQVVFYLVFTFCFLMQGDEIYDAMLNQTNLGQNNNKFFVVQVLGYA